MVNLEKAAPLLERDKQTDGIVLPQLRRLGRYSGTLTMALATGVASSFIWNAVMPQQTIVKRTINNYYGSTPNHNSLPEAQAGQEAGGAAGVPNIRWDPKTGDAEYPDYGEPSGQSASSGEAVVTSYSRNTVSVSNNNLCIVDDTGTHC